MEKTGVLGVILFVLVSSSCIASAVRINEVELNPSGEDSGNEWIELYSPSQVDLSGWVIENARGKNISVNDSFEDYYILATPYNFLANSKQKLTLISDSGEIVDETTQLSDAANDERTWQYCGEWKFLEQSKGEENLCGEVVKNVSPREETKPQTENTDKGDNQDSEKMQDNIPKVSITNATKESEGIGQGTSEVIKLEAQGIKTWKSQEARIKEWSLLGFTLFCFITLTVLLIKAKRQEWLIK